MSDDIGDLRLPKLKRREHPFEYRLRDELAKRDVMFVKVKPTIEGFPDRLAIGHGSMRLVETKTPDGELEPTQVIVHGQIAKRCRPVIVAVGPDARLAADLICDALASRV